MSDMPTKSDKRRRSAEQKFVAVKTRKGIQMKKIPKDPIKVLEKEGRKIPKDVTLEQMKRDAYEEAEKEVNKLLKREKKLKKHKNIRRTRCR